MTEFDKIVLFRREVLTLIMCRIKPQPKSEWIKSLYSLDLVRPALTGEIGRHLRPVSTGKFKITEKGKRYLRYKHIDRMQRIFTTIVVSILTNIALVLLRWILQSGLPN